MTGRFVVFEGLDGSGTSTQIAKLADWLRSRGVGVETSSEPTAGPVGAVIRLAIEKRITLDPAALALAFASDRIDHLRNPEHGIDATTAWGRWALTDRYVLSSLAYQTSQGLPTAFVEGANAEARTPDLTVFVDTSVEVAAQRIQRRSHKDELFHHVDKLRAIRAAYDTALEHPRFVGPLVRVDGDADPDTVFAAVLAGVRKEFPEVG